MSQIEDKKPQLNPHPLSPYLAWAGERNRDAILEVLQEWLFKVNGEFSSESNQEFDKKLRSAGVTYWGLKDIADVTSAAEVNSLRLKDKIDMPANNFSLIFSK